MNVVRFLEIQRLSKSHVRWGETVTLEESCCCLWINCAESRAAGARAVKPSVKGTEEKVKGCAKEHFPIVIVEKECLFFRDKIDNRQL